MARWFLITLLVTAVPYASAADEGGFKNALRYLKRVVWGEASSKDFNRSQELTEVLINGENSDQQGSPINKTETADQDGQKNISKTLHTIASPIIYTALLSAETFVIYYIFAHQQPEARSLLDAVKDYDCTGTCQNQLDLIENRTTRALTVGKFYASTEILNAMVNLPALINSIVRKFRKHNKRKGYDICSISTRTVSITLRIFLGGLLYRSLNQTTDEIPSDIVELFDTLSETTKLILAVTTSDVILGGLDAMLYCYSTPQCTTRS